MNRRRIYVALALCALSTPPSVLLVRRAADAQRRRPGAAAAAGRANPAARSPAASARLPTVLRGAQATASAAPALRAAFDGLDPSRARRDGGRYVVDLPAGRHATLTLEPNWQRQISLIVERHQIPRSSIVILDSDTGRVRVYVSRGEPGAPDLARDPTPPAASVFKIVTSSALLTRGVDENTTTCFSGGFHALVARDLQADPRRDRDCISLADAFGRSANSVFGRRAVEHLQPADLLQTAHAWGFGEAVPFDATMVADSVDAPDVPLEFARAAAGFFHSQLSPVHAAVMAQAIVRGGEMQRPFIVESLTDARGVVVAAGAPQLWRRAVPPEVAAALARMMVHSVAQGGTAYHAFHDPQGNAYLPGVDVSGKTGTLNAINPFRAYTWFVGNASGNGQRVSFAVMVANGPVWHIKAAALARQALQVVFRGRATD